MEKVKNNKQLRDCFECNVKESLGGKNITIDDSKYVDAIREYNIAYKGVEYKGEQVIQKQLGLKQVRERKKNCDSFQNFQTSIKQQAGFSGEILEVAKRNEEYILKGEKVRAIRTDDLHRVNDPYGDIAIIDENGKEIFEGQLKFVGKNASEMIQKFLSKEYDKYFEHGESLIIPKNELENAKNEIIKRKAKCQEQISKIEKSDNPNKEELLKTKKNQIKKLEQIEQSLQEGRIDRKTAQIATLFPGAITIKHQAKLASEVGKEYVKKDLMDAAFDGLENSLDKYKDGELTSEEIVLEVTKQVGERELINYSKQTAKACLKGNISNSKIVNQLVGKAGGDVNSVDAINSAEKIYYNIQKISQTVYRFCNGENDVKENIIQIAEDGFQDIIVGCAAFLGEFFGNDVGRQICQRLVRHITDQIKYANRECRYSKKMYLDLKSTQEYFIDKERKLQDELRDYSKRKYTEKENYFFGLIETLENAAIENDIEKYFEIIKGFGEKYDYDFQFASFQEFDDFMNEKDSVFIF